MNSAFVGYEELSRSRRVLSTSADNTLLDLLNSSYPTQPHSLIANYQYHYQYRCCYHCHYNDKSYYYHKYYNSCCDIAFLSLNPIPNLEPSVCFSEAQKVCS